MIDIIIVVCCILGGFAIGKFFENRASSKSKFYMDLVRYMSALNENIVGRQLEIAQFDQQFALNCSKEFGEYLINGQLKLNIAKPQRDNIETFFENLSCSGSKSLSNHIAFYSKIFVNDANEIQSELSKAAIYGKLGMLLGAMIGILLI